MDPKHVVAAGYDRMHDDYVAWSGGHAGRRRKMVDAVVARYFGGGGRRALDLGCATGELGTRVLVQSGFDVTGVDISPKSIEAARRTVPDATFVAGDFVTVDLPEASFDLVTAFYSIIHVPRDEHAAVFAIVHRWLRPGGVFLASLGVSDLPEGTDDDWLGGPMYWSHFDADTTMALVEEAGLQVVADEIETNVEDGRPVQFLWLTAERPMPRQR